MLAPTASPAPSPSTRLGAHPTADGTRFAVWTTSASRVSVRLFDDERRPRATHALEPHGDGLFAATLRDAPVGTLYAFVLDDRELPDPYARALPFGVHGPARVTPVAAAPPRFTPPPFDQWIVYELHVGTFTPEGTYAAAKGKLDALASLGVSAIELMPVSSFAGHHGWGYDGVAHFAPHAPYGTPDELRDLIAACHARGMAVLLDLVLNHFGPAGSYLRAYAEEYFTSAHQTPWGDAPDYTNRWMRAYAVDCARMWLDEYGFDGLRLDATHAIVDDSPRHVLRELADLAAGLTPPRVLVAEDDRNDPNVVLALGMRAVWADDFHHQVRVALTGERDGYYRAYGGTAKDVADTILRGWYYEGQTYPTRDEPRGAPAPDLPASSFVYCVQNHDQIGNRAMGTRLSHDAGIDGLCAASMLLLFLPMTPLLFMGQEWAASTPFLYFSDHEPELGALVSKGRREEFKHFAAFQDPKVRARIPDPQAASTFEASKLRWAEREEPPHARVLALHRAMIELRRRDPILSWSRRDALRAEARGDLLIVTRTRDDHRRTLVVNLGRAPAAIPRDVAGERLLASAPFAGDALPPHGAIVLAR